MAPVLCTGVLGRELPEFTLSELVHDIRDCPGYRPVGLDPAFIQFLDGSGSHASGDDRINLFSDKRAHGLAHAVGVVLVPIVDDLDRALVCVANGEIRRASEVLIDLCGFSIFSCGRDTNFHEFLLWATNIWWHGWR